jgi:hypothetical protein
LLLLPKKRKRLPTDLPDEKAVLIAERTVTQKALQLFEKTATLESPATLERNGTS